MSSKSKSKEPSRAADFKSVAIGGMNESGYASATAVVMRKEKLGKCAVLFCGPWTPEKLENAIGEFRKGKMTFLMDEVFNRLTGAITSGYEKILPEVLEVLRKNADICTGSLLICEYGGMLYYWPRTTVQGSACLPPPAEDLLDAAQKAEAKMRASVEEAEKKGLPRPYVCIEPSGMVAFALRRAGFDRTDHEVVYNAETELSYSAHKGAVLTFGGDRFGVDMAMVWYGGNQHDALWFRRWRTSLFHAYLRGADPIYTEHGLMDYKALGKNLGTGAAEVKRFRKAVAELVKFARHNKRPAGLPLAGMTFILGRGDGFANTAGIVQTHQWGQRENDRFLLTDAEKSWKLFELLYRRRDWIDRERCGERDYSGNPPFGQADVLPFDAPDELLSRYRTAVFLGRNVMDEELYGKLVRFVQNGGVLLMTAAHLNTSADPEGGVFAPCNDGDWSELFGVRCTGAGKARFKYGLKFVKNPEGADLHLPLWSVFCDPKFSCGAFPMNDLELAGGEIVAVQSEGFADKDFDFASAPAVVAKRLGKGTAILVNANIHPGNDALKDLYSLLLLACAAECAEHCELKIEASDRVRYSAYRTGDGGLCVFLLNTEENLAQEVLVNGKKYKLRPGQMKRILLDAR